MFKNIYIIVSFRSVSADSILLPQVKYVFAAVFTAAHLMNIGGINAFPTVILHLPMETETEV